MARSSVSKTRATVEKSRPPTVQTPLATREIVPGKFSDADWNFMLDRDGNEDFVAEIVDELIDTSMDAMFKRYLDHQLLPFTISQAKDAIIEIIEWNFLARDEGEEHINTDLGWAEDGEPESADTDCWAQGSIPKSFVTVAPLHILKEIPEVTEAETAAEVSVSSLKDIPQEPAELPDEVSDTEGPPVLPAEKVTVNEKVIKTARDLKSDKRQSSHGEIKSPMTLKKISDEIEMKKLLEENIISPEKSSNIQKTPTYCSSFVKTMIGHTIGLKDALCDEMGNVIAVPKIDSEKLPTHRVNVKYTVIEAAKEIVQIKGDLKKRQQSSRQKSRIMETLTDVPNRGNQVRHSFQNPSTHKSLPGTLIEEIEVAQGIIIREAGRVKKGPGRYYRKLDILDDSFKGMKPVSLKNSNPTVTVADLLDRQTPILRPYGASSPLPPIVLHHQQQTKQAS